MTRAGDAARGLLRVLATAARGPRRDGVFALWLTVRVASDIAEEPAWPERAHRRRVALLQRRLTSLTLPPPLRRALSSSLADLEELTPERAALAVTQLVAPARESLGPEAADAVRRVAVSLRGR